MQATICDMQDPLRDQLNQGVEELKEKVSQFHVDFECNGPMVLGIPAKEASERYSKAQNRGTYFDRPIVISGTKI